MSVTARSAARDGESLSEDRESLLRFLWDVCRFWGWAPYRWLLVVGILTGLVGVVGLIVKLTVVFGGLEGERLEVSRQSLRLPIVASEVE